MDGEGAQAEAQVTERTAQTSGAPPNPPLSLPSPSPLLSLPVCAGDHCCKRRSRRASPSHPIAVRNLPGHRGYRPCRALATEESEERRAAMGEEMRSLAVCRLEPTYGKHRAAQTTSAV